MERDAAEARLADAVNDSDKYFTWALLCLVLANQSHGLMWWVWGTFTFFFSAISLLDDRIEARLRKAKKR